MCNFIKTLNRKLSKKWHLISIVKSIIIFKLFGIEGISRILSETDPYMTYYLLKRYGASIGRNVVFKGNIFIDNASTDQDATNDFQNLIIGNNCYIGKNIFFDIPHKIILNDDVVIGAGASFFTHEDCGKRIMSKWFPRRVGEITIGKGAWIGANATILCGVTVGEESMVAAGSIVIKSVENKTLVAGVPACVIRRLV